jgi:predicted glutamine amidotransferase
MCRFLSVVSSFPTPLPDLLGDNLAHFTELAAEHGDGWGVSYWDGRKVSCVKEHRPARASAAFARAVGRITTDAAVLHIRLATPGSPITLQNTHPFVGDSTAFSHNGDFSPADAVDQLIDPRLLAEAKGNTDTERYFLLIRTYLRRGDPAAAIALAADDIRSQAKVSGLNCMLLTSAALYVYAGSDPQSEVSQRRGPDYFRLVFRNGPDRVLVASTGWPQPPAQWNPLEDGEVVEIRRGSLRATRLRARPVAAPVGLIRQRMPFDREAMRGVPMGQQSRDDVSLP